MNSFKTNTLFYFYYYYFLSRATYLASFIYYFSTQVYIYDSKVALLFFPFDFFSGLVLVRVKSSPSSKYVIFFPSLCFQRFQFWFSIVFELHFKWLYASSDHHLHLHRIWITFQMISRMFLIPVIKDCESTGFEPGPPSCHVRALLETTTPAPNTLLF